MIAAESTRARPGLRTETATWPPLEAVDVGGWRAGLSGGFTRRGNSVVALGTPNDPDAALDEVEALYAARGLPSVVRVCRDSRPADLDDMLEARGYTVAATTLVMAVALPVGAAAPPGEPLVGAPVHVDVAAEPDEAWLRGWLAVKASTPVDLDLAGRLVGGAPARYARAHDADGTLGVVRTATADGWVALSCLTVQVRARRHGLGRWLTLDALAAAHAEGVPAAYLQVEEGNAAGRALYAGLGFEVVDRYHYRERPVPR